MYKLIRHEFVIMLPIMLDLLFSFGAYFFVGCPLRKEGKLFLKQRAWWLRKRIAETRWYLLHFKIQNDYVRHCDQTWPSDVRIIWWSLLKLMPCQTAYRQYCHVTLRSLINSESLLDNLPTKIEYICILKILRFLIKVDVFPSLRFQRSKTINFKH